MLDRPGRMALLALAPVLLALEIPGAIELFGRPEDGLTLRDRTVMVVNPGGPAERAGLQPRDLLVAVDSLPIHNYGSYLAATRDFTAGDTLHVRVRRGHNEATVELTLDARSTEQIAHSLLLSVVGICFVLLGFATYLRRDDRLGRYFYLSCLLFAYNWVDLPTFASASLMHVLEGLRGASQLIWVAVFLRFFFLFPEGASEVVGLARRRWLLAVPIALAPLHVLLHFGKAGTMESPAAELLSIVSAIIVVAYLLTGVTVFVRKSLRRDRYAHWSRLRLAVAGVFAGLAPLVVTSVFRLFWPTSQSWMDLASVLFLPLVPASFSMAILRSGAIDLSRVGRQTLQLIVLALPFAVISFAFVRFATPAGPPRGTVPILVLLGAISVAIASSIPPLRQLVAHWLDQLLYREQRRIRTAAAELGHELSRERDPELLVTRYCHGVATILGAARVIVYEFDGEHLRLAGEVGDRQWELPATVPATSRLLKLVTETDDILFVPPLLSGSTVRRLDAPSHELLRASDAVALCPLLAAGEVNAILLFSAPLDGSNYGSLQLYHVQQLSRQAAVALESARLHQEDVERERLHTELDLAREIQSKLLPAGGLERGDFHICGRMQASRQVGGDLYDHFELADGKVVVTVADASGKGVPASLLMSSVRSAVREVMRPGLAPAEAMNRLNREVHEATTETHFIAVFLGVLDLESGVLEYTVGGIEPPIWSRAAQERAEFLTRGGAPLGIDGSFAYRSGIIRMEPGDVVLAYSDGMIDEEDEAEEPFGITRLKGLARELTLRPASEILDRLMEAVSGHGGEDATDDRTLLVIQRNLQVSSGMKSAAS